MNKPLRTLIISLCLLLTGKIAAADPLICEYHFNSASDYASVFVDHAILCTQPSISTVVGRWDNPSYSQGVISNTNLQASTYGQYPLAVMINPIGNATIRLTSVKIKLKATMATTGDDLRIAYLQSSATPSSSLVNNATPYWASFKNSISSMTEYTYTLDTELNATNGGLQLYFLFKTGAIGNSIDIDYIRFYGVVSGNQEETEILSGVTTTLAASPAVTIPTHIAGLNGRSTEGPSWDDPSFVSLVREMQPSVIRYPGGTIANYWDWRTGTYMEGSGMNSKFPFTIDMLLRAITDQMRIIYVVSMARPTPWTGIPLTATEEVLKSDATLQLKIDDTMAALAEFERCGRIPEVVELGNEFYFQNEHAGIYARQPELYLDHAKVFAQRIKAKYPQIQIILITTKADSPSRDAWNGAIFDRLQADSELRGLVYGVVQHHYINETYGDPTLVTDRQTAIKAISEGVTYVTGCDNSYNVVTNGMKIFLTEYGSTKPNAPATWASGLRAAAMSMSWLKWGDKLENMMYHHVTNEPDVINKSAYRMGTVGITYSLFSRAMHNKTQIRPLQFDNCPELVAGVPSVLGYKISNATQEGLLLLNLSNYRIDNLNLSSLIGHTQGLTMEQYNCALPELAGVFLNNGVNFNNSVSENMIYSIPPFSFTYICNNNIPAGVVTPDQTTSLKAWKEGNKLFIRFSVNTIGQPFSIIDTTGRVVMTGIADSTEKAITIDLNQKGLYAIVINQEILKIAL